MMTTKLSLKRALSCSPTTSPKPPCEANVLVSKDTFDLTCTSFDAETGLHVLDSAELAPTCTTTLNELDVLESNPIKVEPQPSPSDLQPLNDSEICSKPTGKKPRVDEILSFWNMRRLFEELGTNFQCVRFAEDRGLILRQKICRLHRKPMSLKTTPNGTGVFECCKRTCLGKSYSRTKGTWFENVKIPLPIIFQIMYMFSHSFTHEQVRRESMSRERGTILSITTVIDWYKYCREVIILYELEHQKYNSKIGGPNKVVQIDKAKFCTRKNQKAKDGHWVIGMIQDSSDDLRLEECPDNDGSPDVLIPLIKKHVEEGTIIHTDSWSAFDCLPDHGYIHKKITSSDNTFVGADGTHTQRIRSLWQGLKKSCQDNQYKISFVDWLVEYSWRRRVRLNRKDPFEELLNAVLSVYRP